MNIPDARLAADRAGIADYRFVRSLGAGNHGVFYLAYRPERLHIDAEFVAVKVLSGSNSQDTFRRATRELAAFAAVRSPYLVTLYDAGQQGDDLYYSMEYLPAGSLADAIGALPPGQVLAAVADAARAADALHEAGIAHNDIKPGNIMLHDGHAKLSDLGLSQLLTPGLTITGIGSTGSVEYLDPAVIRGEMPGRATDIFALGATLHRALTGRGLYGELPTNNTMLAMRRVLSHAPEVSPNLPPGVREVIANAINPNPAARPATAAALAARIDAMSEDVL
ncbi:MAG TPA: serine/threonine-protein kinase [Streptosporangiaceae bacterium]|nr:serine/threonine-protein kinase [Streptosporangiaceae bacterium]